MACRDLSNVIIHETVVDENGKVHEVDIKRELVDDLTLSLGFTVCMT